LPRDSGAAIEECNPRTAKRVRAGLEPAAYGLEKRTLIAVLASSSIVKSCAGRCLGSSAWSVRLSQIREGSLSRGFVRGSRKARWPRSHRRASSVSLRPWGSPGRGPPAFQLARARLGDEASNARRLTRDDIAGRTLTSGSQIRGAPAMFHTQLVSGSVPLPPASARRPSRPDPEPFRSARSWNRRRHHERKR